MITFEEAEKIAFSKTGGMTVCDEYEKAYRFFDPYNDADGGCDIVVLKETGKAISFVQFILNYHPEKNPKRKTMYGVMDDGWSEEIRHYTQKAKESE